MHTYDVPFSGHHHSGIWATPLPPAMRLGRGWWIVYDPNGCIS